MEDPKQDPKQEVKKKRARKKTCEIDSIEKLRVEPLKPTVKPIKTNVSDGSTSHDTGLNQSHISFGKFNITVKKMPNTSPEELRNYYDKKFKIDDSEKTAKLMVQEQSESMLLVPIMENESNNNTNNTNASTNAIQQKVSIKDTTNHHKVLSSFIGSSSKTWPTSTNLLCWWCCHPFEGVPLPCPIEYDDVRDRYKVNGVFCGWSCISAYSIREYSSLSLVYQMRKQFEPDFNSEISVAPPRFCLKNFGGYMDIEKFRDHNKTTLLISTEHLSYINQEIVEIRN